MNTEDKKRIAKLELVLKSAQEEIEALKEKADEEDWPKKGDWYWTYNTMSGEIHRFNWINSSADNKYKDNRMIFRTKEEAELSRDQGLAYRMLWEMADDGKYIIINGNSGDYVAEAMSRRYGLPGFSTKEKAMEAINIIGTELLNKIFP